jgi:hypothetical protein
MRDISTSIAKYFFIHRFEPLDIAAESAMSRQTNHHKAFTFIAKSPYKGSVFTRNPPLPAPNLK